MRHTALLYTVLSFLTLCASCSHRHGNGDLEPYFAAADSVLELRDYYRGLMNNRILRLRLEAERARTVEEVYLVGRMLTDCYRNYICDSALVVIKANEQLARALGSERYLVETYFDDAYVNSAVADFNSAQVAFRNLQTLHMTDEERVWYYALRIYYYNHMQDFFRRPYRFQIEQYCDSILLMDPDIDPDARLWARFWKEFDSTYDTVSLPLMAEIKARVDTFGQPDIRWYSNLNWALATTYGTRGDIKNNLKYLTQSLATDLSRCNNDIPSLFGIGYMAYLQGYQTHAHRFMKAYLDLQTDFPSRSQNLVLAHSMESLYEKIAAKSLAEAQRRQAIIFTCVAVCVLMACVTTLLLMRRRHHLQEAQRMAHKNQQLDQSLHDLHAAQEQLRQANEQLTGKNARIEQMVAQLANANLVKEEHIANLFTQCSDYITRMDEIRKTTLRQLKAKKYDEATRRLSEGELLVADQVQELYKNFDALFLGIYPDFIRDFNTLLRPEEQISLRTPDTLNNDLRIYALIRLGINSSAKIAESLHLSPQTVYNARTRMRSRAICPPEEFPKRVRQLGRFHPSPPPSPQSPHAGSAPSPSHAGPAPSADKA